MNEELREGKTIVTSIDEGFKRAWSSIRDSNISSLITCLFLFLFTTSLVKGFALTLGIGILVSMFTAITISRTLLKLILKPKIERG
jgi:preprotein translocase subunit SecD